MDWVRSIVYVIHDIALGLAIAIKIEINNGAWRSNSLGGC